MAAPRIIRELHRTLTFEWDAAATTTRHTQLFVVTPRGDVFAALSGAYASIADKELENAKDDVKHIVCSILGKKDKASDLKHRNKQLKDVSKVNR